MGETKTLRLKLKYWRTRRALNIRQLAKISGVSSATIVKIENENYVPRPDVIHKLSEHLKVTIDELLVDDEEKPTAA